MDRVVRRFLIVGFGIVGKAVHAGLLQNETYDVAVLDPPLDMNILDDGIRNYADYNFYDGIILTLPTPQGPVGECDDMAVEQYVQEIRKVAPRTPILIKSTISIELIDLLGDDPYLTTNPEFLTEADNLSEFLHQRFTIFGGRQCRFWYDVFLHAGIVMDNVKFTDKRTAAFAKYAINSYLATKVIFFNELRDFFGPKGFDELTECISLDERIGSSHMMVPGPDREYGFGGMCFPKDTSAFLRSSHGKLTLLEKARQINDDIKADRRWI
jgi:UDP-glucose 6-dehydrogenase|tara:strand:+ start:449 stop:1255 length:807 start_codon:yes stop_codon:yes gene_type:complete